MENKNKEEDLKENSQGGSPEVEFKSKKDLSIEEQKKLLLILNMRKNFAPTSFLIKRIKKNIATLKTLKNINKDEK